MRIMRRANAVQGEFYALRADGSFDPATRFLFGKDVRHRRQVHEVNSFMHFLTPVMRVAEEDRLDLLTRHEDLEQFLGVLNAAELFAFENRMMMDGDERRLIGMGIERRGEPLQLSFA